MSPFEITLVVSILVLGFYGVYGLINFDRTSSFEAFFLNHRTLSRANVRNTFSGASISIATVLIFFLTIGIAFGWHVFVSPITLAIGLLAFNYLIYPRLTNTPTLMRSLRGAGPTPIFSLMEYLDFTYRNRLVSLTITFISALGVFAILVAELMVGVRIYGQYFLEPRLIVLIIGLCLFLYAGFGGMKSVVETDRWQVIFILVSLALILAAVIAGIAGRPSHREGLSQLLVEWTPVQTMPFALVIHIFFVNLCLLPSSLRVWQVVAASSKTTGFQRALWESLVIILFVVVASLLISKGIAILNGTPVNTLDSIFSFLTKNDAWISFFVYPVFVVALLSALISTADSAILPLSQLYATLRYRKEDFNVIRNLRNMVGLIILTVAIFYLVTEVLGMELVPWILTVFSITTSVAPVVVAPLFFPHRKVRRLGGILVSASALAGFASALAWSVHYQGDISVQPWNCVIGFAISFVGTVAAFRLLSDLEVGAVE